MCHELFNRYPINEALGLLQVFTVIPGGGNEKKHHPPVSALLNYVK